MRGGKVPESLQRGQRISLAERIAALVKEMHRCVEKGEALNFSAAAHREITEALRILVYEPSDPTLQPTPQLKAVYEDGSVPTKRLAGTRNAGAVPVRCLSEIPKQQRANAQSLHVGTLSFRHLDYDGKIDLYLIRDRETRILSNGELQDLAYDRMKELVSDPLLRSRDSSIVLFQTGLEPLVVGVYAAVIEELVTRRANAFPTLAIQPIFFADGDATARGRAWN